MSGEALRALLVSFGVDVTGAEKLDSVDKKIDGIIKGAKQFGAVLGEAFALEKLKSFIEAQIQAGAELKVTSERLGASVEELQALELAAGEAGVGTEALTTGLRFLNRNLGEAATGSGDGAKKFSELHIAIKNADGTTRAASDVLGELADKIVALKDPAKATSVAMELLGRGGVQLVPMLLKGGDAFRQARAEMERLGGGMSGDFVEQVHEAEAANVRLNFAMTGLKSQIAIGLLPAVEKIVEWFTKGAVAAIEFSKRTNAMKTGLEALAVASSVKAGYSLVKLAGTMGLLKPTILETVSALAKFAAPIAIIAGLYLAFDEFYTMMDGGKTVIGDTLDELFGFGTAAEIALYLNAVFEDTKRIFSDLGTIIKEEFLAALALAADAIKAVDLAMGNLMMGKLGAAGDALKQGGAAMMNDAGKHMDKAGGAANDLLGGKAMAVEQVGSLLGAGVAPQQLLAGQLGRQTYLTQNQEGRKRMEAYAAASAMEPGPARDKAMAEATAMPHDNRFYTPSDRTVHVPTIPHHDARGGAGGGGASVDDRREYHTDVKVYTSSDRPKEVGAEVGAAIARGQGVATPAQRANNNALQGVKRP